MIDALQSVLSSLTCLPVVWAHQDAPRPARPYATLAITSVNAIGSDESGHVDTHDRQRTVGQRTADVRLAVFEAEDESDPRRAVSRLAGLRDALRAPRARDALYAGGVSVYGDQTVTAVPVVKGTLWQPQAVLDLRLGFASAVDLPQYWIERVTGRAEVEALGRDYGNDYLVEVG